MLVNIHNSASVMVTSIMCSLMNQEVNMAHSLVWQGMELVLHVSVCMHVSVCAGCVTESDMH